MICKDKLVFGMHVEVCECLHMQCQKSIKSHKHCEKDKALKSIYQN